MCDADGRIHALVDEVYDAIDEHHVRGHFWVALEKSIHDRCQVTPPECYRSRDRQPADWLASACDQNVLCLLGRCKNVATALQILCALIGQMNASRRALEKRDPKLTFERRERTHDRRQRG